jgi:hypothetical protein
MKFEEAVKTIKKLIGPFNSLSFKCDVSYNKWDDREKIQVGIIWIIPFGEKQNAESIYDETWQGVIDKLEAKLKPKLNKLVYIASMEELPNL